MILMIITLGTLFLLFTIIYMFHGIYINNIDLKVGIKGFNLKIETKEKKHPSAQD